MSAIKDKNMVHVDLSSLLFIKARIISGNLERENRFELNESDYANMVGIMTSALFKLKQKYNAEFVLIHQDGFRDNIWRRDIHPNYKRNRSFKKKTEIASQIFFDIARKGMFQVIDRILDICKAHDMIAVKLDRLEADDSIYLAIKRWNDDYNHFIITKDGDLLQNRLYFPNVRVFLDNGDEHDYTMVQEKIYKKVVSGDAKDGVHHIASRYTLSPGFEKWVKDIYLRNGIVVEDAHDLMMVKTAESELFKMQDLYFEKCNDNPIKKKNSKTFKAELYTNSLDVIEEEIKTKCEKWMYNNFVLNKKLILFPYIPKELQDKIYEVELQTQESIIAPFKFII